MNGASIAAIHAMRSDESDEQVMQKLQAAINAYTTRFGEKALVDCLEDLLRVIKD